MLNPINIVTRQCGWIESHPLFGHYDPQEPATWGPKTRTLLDMILDQDDTESTLIELMTRDDALDEENTIDGECENWNERSVGFSNSPNSLGEPQGEKRETFEM